MLPFGLYCKGERGLAVVTALLAHGLCPAYCVTETRSDVLVETLGDPPFPLLVSGDPKNALHLDLIQRHSASFLLCAGYSRIFPENLIKALPQGVVNLHGGRLPQYRGASPIPWQLIQGEHFGEANVLYMDEGIDTGPIISSERVPIQPDDTARSVTNKVLASFARMVPPIIGQLTRGESPTSRPQNPEGACHWTRRYPEDGRIHWHATQTDVYNLIRALDDPYPGAFFLHGGARVTVWRARLPALNMRGVPGMCVGVSQLGPLIMTGTGPIELLTVQWSGTSQSDAASLGLKYGDRVD